MSDVLNAFRDAQPETAIILGSGLGSVADGFFPTAELPYADVPGLPVSTVPGHAGKFLLGQVEGKAVVIAQGRSHLYEGLTAKEVTASVRFLAEQLGVKKLVLTNAAGAIEPTFRVGGLMMIQDHLNLQGQSPLTGGPHFHDMTTVYDPTLRDQCQDVAAALQIHLLRGVYAAVPGPQYETPAEVRMLKLLGAHAVGMSTVPEAIQARALGLQVLGLSMLTNWAAGIAPSALSHSEVVEVGQKASADLARLLTGLVAAS